jgi:hypothetical protein
MKDVMGYWLLAIGYLADDRRGRTKASAPGNGLSPEQLIKFWRPEAANSP